MEKDFGIITFLNSIQDTFPYIESAILVLDNKLNWWKKNYKTLEEKIANISAEIANENKSVSVRFTIYNGPDENVQSVKWSGPAIEFTFIETSNDFANKVKNKLGENTWEGHKMFVDDNKLFILIE